MRILMLSTMIGLTGSYQNSLDKLQEAFLVKTGVNSNISQLSQSFSKKHTVLTNGGIAGYNVYRLATGKVISGKFKIKENDVRLQASKRFGSIFIDFHF